MLPILQWRSLSTAERKAVLQRPAQRTQAQTTEAARAIIDRVRTDGDAALLALTRELDGVDFSLTPIPSPGGRGEKKPALTVTEAEFSAAEAALTAEQKSALDQAIGNVRRFHEPQALGALRVETSPGVVCERRVVPIRAVGLYVPAGSAPLPSTAIMLAVPALLAGCPTRILCTPPRRDGRADEAVLYVARRCGIGQVFKLGGAQAIAAMAYGTATVPKTDKIFGPGNAWVTAAKQLVAADSQGAACDLPAGPSEVLVIADESARVDFVSADLLAQAEHSPDAQVLLVTTSQRLAEETRVEIERQCDALARNEIARKALAGSRIVVVDTLDTALAVSNDYGPEHLILEVEQPRRWLDTVTSAGSVFLGAWTPESLGDYCSGTNHVLPTYGYARAWSGLSLLDFSKRITVQEATPDGLRGLGPVACTLAELEGLGAHANAVRVRLQALPSAIQDGGGGVFMNSVLKLARPDLLELQAYSHAAWEPALERLHANESPWRMLSDNSPTGLNRYPEPQPRVLAERLAQLYGVEPERVLVGRGSDEAIDLLVRGFCRAERDSVIVCPPTFGMYKVAARIQGAKVIEAPLLRERGFALDEAEILARCEPSVKIVFLCSPNNPTGTLMDSVAIERLCAALDGRALVVVDEAYNEFAGVESFTTRLRRFPNLVVLRTLSKAFALAGARCGTLIGDPALVDLLYRLIPPYALPSPSIDAALRALEPLQQATSAARLQTILAERSRVAAALAELPSIRKVWPSAANFLLVDCADAERCLRTGIAAGLLVRDFRSQSGLGNSLRVTIGSPEQNDRLLKAWSVL